MNTFFNKKIKNIAGHKYGRLTVTRKFKQKERGILYWLCRCDCGNEKWVNGIKLRAGGVRSCGCLNKEHMRKVAEKNKIEYGLASKRRIFRRYKNDAKRKNHFFGLTFKQFINIIQQNCFYCGIKPANVQTAEGNNGDFIYNGIDRMNNRKGYTIENCVPCCSICNKAKNTMNKILFLNWIKRIYKHNWENE